MYLSVVSNLWFVVGLSAYVKLKMHLSYLKDSRIVPKRKHSVSRW